MALLVKTPETEELRELSSAREVPGRLAAAALAAARQLGGDEAAADPRWWRAFGLPEAPAEARTLPTTGDADDGGVPDRLGRLHELLRWPGDRRRHGAVYTPRHIAEGLVVAALDGSPMPERVCDPAVGGGAFLLAAARVLRARGVAVDDLVEHRLWGADLDPLATATARVSLALWSLEESGCAAWVPPEHLVVADPLCLGAQAWSADGAVQFDLVVGNPPFQSQLQSETTRERSVAEHMAGRLGLGRLGYADTAVLFLVLGCELAAPGGRVALIEPQSMLAARDAAAARRAVAERADLVGMWVDTESVFDAAVRVWAPIVERHGDPSAAAGSETSAPPPRTVRRLTGPCFEVAPTVARPKRSGGSSWAPLVADLLGGPPLDLDRDGDLGGVLSDLASATAGFRDQFYGLIPYVIEAAAAGNGEGPAPDSTRFAPLVTAGAIDPARNRWGRHPVRFAGRSWARPAVDIAALRRGNPRLAAWVAARLVPKVLVAPQTTVIEALPDPGGLLVPSTPVVAVAPAATADVSLIAALLCSPPASAWVFRQSAGTGMSAGALRVPARTLLQLPLPALRDRWQEAADHLDIACAAASEGDEAGWLAGLDDLARAMTAAYGLEEEHPVVAWWGERRPTWR